MSRIFRTALLLPLLLLCSCGAIMESMIDSMFDSAFESSSDRKIRKDTERMRKGEPLQHFKSERQLKAVRQWRAIDEIQSN